MQNYRYRARDRAGRLVSGVAAFETEEQARSFLRSNKLMALDLQVEAPKVTQKFDFLQRLQPINLVPVVRQLAIMLKTGVPLDRTFEVLIDQKHPPALAEALRAVARDVHSGSSLSEAMERHPRVFPEMLTALVKAGETGGVLDSSLDEAARQLTWQRELTQKVVTASMYPLFTAVICMVMVTIMLTMVVPSFVQIYSTAQSELPFLTKMLLDASWAVCHRGPFVALGLIALFWAGKWYSGTEKGEKQLHQLQLKLPILGYTLRKIAVAKFCRTLNLLLDAGVPILEALRVSADASGNRVIKDSIATVREDVGRGQQLSVPLERTQQFPTLVIRMVSVGEMTGVLPEVLREVVHVYTIEIDEEIKRAVNLMEPIMVVVLGGIVGVLLVALYLPILNIVNVAAK